MYLLSVFLYKWISLEVKLYIMKGSISLLESEDLSSSCQMSCLRSRWINKLQILLYLFPYWLVIKTPSGFWLFLLLNGRLVELPIAGDNREGKPTIFFNWLQLIFFKYSKTCLNQTSNKVETCQNQISSEFLSFQIQYFF